MNRAAWSPTGKATLDHSTNLPLLVNKEIQKAAHIDTKAAASSRAKACVMVALH